MCINCLFIPQKKLSCCYELTQRKLIGDLVQRFSICNYRNIFIYVTIQQQFLYSLRVRMSTRAYIYIYYKKGRKETHRQNKLFQH